MDKKFKRNINFYSQNIDYLKFKNFQSLKSKSMASYIVLKMLKRITNVERAQTISPYFKKMRIMGIPEREERKRGMQSLFKEIVAENFTNLGKRLNTQIHKTKRTPNYRNTKKTFSKTHDIKTVKSQ